MNALSLLIAASSTHQLYPNETGQVFLVLDSPPRARYKLLTSPGYYDQPCNRSLGGSVDFDEVPSLAVVLETIAHELRQPLSAIESIAYYLNLALPHDGGPGRAQAVLLQELVEQSNWILTCALQLADPSPLVTELLDLEKLITHTATARLLHDRSQNIFRLELAGGLPLVRLDPRRARNLLENLLMLFEQVSSDLYPARLITSTEEKGVSLRMATATPGYRSEAYLGPGCGLSIASARHIVEAHNGTFHMEVDAASGVSLKVVLP